MPGVCLLIMMLVLCARCVFADYDVGVMCPVFTDYDVGVLCPVFTDYDVGVMCPVFTDYDVGVMCPVCDKHPLFNNNNNNNNFILSPKNPINSSVDFTN